MRLSWRKCKGLRGRWRREEGSVLVEFTVSCLVLIPVFFGFIVTCLAFYTYNFVADAAREGSRYAMVRGGTCKGLPDCGFTTSATIQNYLRSLGYPGLNANNLTATVSWSRASSTTPTTWTACGGACNQPGNQVQVIVRYNFPVGIPFISPTALSISSVSSMVIAQ